MTWMRPPTTAFSPLTNLETQRPNKFHIIGEWLSETNWVALCDMKARQYAHFEIGEVQDNPAEKCGRCRVMKK